MRRTGWGSWSIGAIGLLVAAMVGSVAPIASAAPGVRRLVTLETPGLESRAVDINESDVSVGSVDRASGNVPVRWDRNGRLTELPLPDGFGTGRANGINDAGTIIGYAYGNDYSTRALSWDRDGSLTALTVPDHENAEADHINRRGVVLGQVYEPKGQQFRAVRWDHGRATLLEPLPGHARTHAWGLLGDNGPIVGDSFGGDAGSDYIPVQWDRSGKATALPVPPGTQRAFLQGANGYTAFGSIIPVSGLTYSVRWDLDKGTVSPIPFIGTAEWLYPTAVNGCGTIVGITRRSYWSAGAKWPASGDAVQLPWLPGHASGGAFAINDAGAVAGISSSADATDDEVPVVWDVAGNVTALEQVPGAKGMPVAMSERGSVLGYAMVKVDQSYRYRSFLWTSSRR